MSLIIRLLILAGIGWFLYRAFRRWQLGQSKRPPQSLDHYETMQRCSGCGTLLPAQALSPDARCGACERARR